LEQAGWKIVATEFHPSSLLRTLNVFDHDFGLWVDCRQEGKTLAAIKNKIIRLVRFLPAKYFLAANDCKKETEKMMMFYQAEAGEEIKKIYLTGEKAADLVKAKNTLVAGGQILPDEALKKKYFISAEKQLSPGTWAIAIGAAERGLIARAEDKLISLMSVGTEEAYRQQKALAFTGFVSTLLAAAAMMFLIIYAGAWSMMVYLQRINSVNLTALNSLPLPADAQDLEARARNFNDLVAPTALLVNRLPRWSLIIAKIKEQIPAGININSFNATTPEGKISVSGTAQSRTILNTFKKNLEINDFFSEVVLPLTNIGQRENIPFTLSFRLSDPTAVYFR
jgi:Tfp pilus assembly protein PilN